MPEQSNPTGAVFVSYASQDAQAAGRIAEALQAVGIEVWLDQSTLRAGDAWDAQIRRQIHECALFVPVISAHTNARIEGYFRREWNLATLRLLDMAHDAPFLLPVVVDETREADARVPDEFLRAQWAWLPAGETPPAFAQRVRQLLGGESPPVRSSQTATKRAVEPSARRRPSARPWMWFAGGSGEPRVWRVGVAVVALFLVLGGGAFWYFQGASDVPAKPASATTSPIAAAARVEKSIAVLPFVNMSPDKDQEYFADGIAEELLNLLAKVPQLRVTSRSSAFSFKGQNLDMPEIGRRLNVAHILEGSVRKSGNQVRITAQLIDTRSDTHLWSETYDRPLDDIFAVQDEIGGAVVTQLKLRLLGAVPTARETDPKAYALYLQARQLSRQGTAEAYEQAIALCQQALAIEPNYAAAWDELARNYRQQVYNGLRPTDEGYRLVREGAEKALAIDPDYAPAHATLGINATLYDRDLGAAARHFEHALALEPANTDVIRSARALAEGLGRFDTNIAMAKYLVARDPVNDGDHANLGLAYLYAGLLDEALASFRTALSLDPNSPSVSSSLGEVLLMKGDYLAALAAIQKDSSEFWRTAFLPFAYYALGRKAESDAALAELIRKHEKDSAYNIAEVLAYRGEADRAFVWLNKAVAYNDSGLLDVAFDPLLANLHKDPRWLPFLRKIGKAPEQLAAIKFDVILPQ